MRIMHLSHSTKCSIIKLRMWVWCVCVVQKWWLVHAWRSHDSLHRHDWSNDSWSPLHQKPIQQGPSCRVADWSLWTLCCSGLLAWCWGSSLHFLSLHFPQQYILTLINIISFFYVMSICFFFSFLWITHPTFDIIMIVVNRQQQMTNMLSYCLCSLVLILCTSLGLIIRTELSAKLIRLLKLCGEAPRHLALQPRLGLWYL